MDSWLIEDGVDYHLFFLRASRALHDLDRRWRMLYTGLSAIRFR